MLGRRYRVWVQFMRVLVLGLLVLLCGLSFGSRAADVGGGPRPSVEPLDLGQIKAELGRCALLYSLRAAFDVVAREDIESLLKNDLKRLAEGESESSKSALDESLL